MEYEIAAAEQVSTAVVRAVSASEDLDPCSLPPLAAVVDPEALDVLCDPQRDGTPRRGGHVSFVFSECRVTVDNGEYLTLESLADRSSDDGGRALADDGSS